MLAVNLTGRGMASAVEWSGALALYRGELINAGISRLVCVRNTRVA